MKVLLLTKYTRMGASSRLRSLQYLTGLNDAGIEVTTSSLFDDAYLDSLYKQGQRSIVAVLLRYYLRLKVLLTVRRYDLVWVEKEIFPYMPAFAERLLAIAGRPYVVDYDDAIFHNYDLSSNPIIRYVLGSKIDKVMRHAACVIAGNEYLADRAREAGAQRIQVIPTVVDHTRYIVRDLEPGEPLVIGWIGSPSTQKYVLEIKSALEYACLKYGAVLSLIGATPQIAEAFAQIQVDVIAWSEETEAELIRQMDVGIMPLPDGPWEKGKCGYKLIQYMACGVPVVASPVGVNVDIVQKAGCGLLAISEAEWKTSLIQLLESAMLRRQVGDAGRSTVENIYSLQQQGSVLARVLSDSRR